MVVHVASESKDAASALNPRDMLISSDGCLSTQVGVYTDCSGLQPVGPTAYLNQCYDRIYFIGHNPGVFTPLMQMKNGDVITYYDSNRSPQVMQVAGVRVVSRFAGVPPLLNSAVVAQFQTCEVLDGSWDRILDMVPL